MKKTLSLLAVLGIVAVSSQAANAFCWSNVWNPAKWGQNCPCEKKCDPCKKVEKCNPCEKIKTCDPCETGAAAPCNPCEKKITKPCDPCQKVKPSPVQQPCDPCEKLQEMNK